MKRSDAVNIISKELSHLVPGYDDRLADRIVSLLEEAGMSLQEDSSLENEQASLAAIEYFNRLVEKIQEDKKHEKK